MRIFEVRYPSGNSDFACGRTNLEALNVYLINIGLGMRDVEDAELIELPQEKWEEYNVYDSEYSEDDDTGDMTYKSFAAWMKENGSTPGVIAVTAE